MAVSGTISTTTFSTIKVIDHAYRRCRIPAQRVTAEMLDIAKDVLYLFLSSLAGNGLHLWCVDSVIVDPVLGQIAYTLPTGTVDVTNAQIRQTTSNAGTASTRLLGTLFSLTTSAAIYTVGWAPAVSGTYALLVETATDGVNYTTQQTVASAAYTTGQTYWFDLPAATTISQICVRDAAGLDVTGATIYAGSNPSEIPLARMNQDDYVNQTNKTFQSKPTTYWLDRQRDAPVMRLWPTPSAQYTSDYQIVVWRERHIMDVGSLTQTLDIPQRWYDAIVYGLAWRLAVETPEVDPNVMASLKSLADEGMSSMMNAERDKSAMKITPNIGVYSR